MRKILQNPLLVPLVAVAVILLATFYGKNHERAALSYFLRGIIPSPHFLQQGTRGDDVVWQVRSVSNKALERELATPGVVVLEDDLEGVFQSSPHAPIDLALIARNMSDLGGQTLAIGAVMAWDSPDVIGLAALERALESFDSVVTTVPLVRGATAESMPSEFRRASLPLSAVKGDTSELPVVNRQMVGDALLGGEGAIAGFTFAGTSDVAEQPHLIARWEDRVVFSFPFLVAMRQAGLSVDSLEIHPGNHIRVGTGGWIIPIDHAGRLKVQLAQTHDWREIGAEKLLDPGADLPRGETRPELWLLRDDRGALDGALRDHATRLVPLVKTLASGAALTDPMELRGTPKSLTWLLLAAVVVLLTTLCRYGAMAIQVGLILTLTGLLALQWTALSMASIWMPGMTAFLAVNVVWVLALPIILARRKTSRIKEEATA